MYKEIKVPNEQMNTVMGYNIWAILRNVTLLNNGNYYYRALLIG